MRLRSWFEHSAVLALVVVTWMAFCASLVTACGPGGRIVFCFGAPLLMGVLLGGLLLPMLFLLVRRWLNRRRHGDPSAGAARILLPATLLGLYPFTVFILHPLGVPLSIAVLVEPWLLVAIAVLVATAQCLQETGLRDAASTAAARILARSTPGRVKGMLFVACLLFYGAITLDNDRYGDLVGDEPHYLLIARSLERYHTADLTRMVHDPRLAPELQSIAPHRSGQSRSGSDYSVHHVGLPLLLVLPDALAGGKGVIIFFNLIAALLVLNIFSHTHEVTGDLRRSLLVAGLMAVTCPIAFYFRFIYPDMVTALLVLFSYRILRRHETRTMPWMVAAISAAAFLPWLHVKDFVLSWTLPWVYVLTGRIRKAHVLIATGCYLVSGIAMMAFLWHAYGSWLPNAQYGGDSPPFSRFFWRGAPGLFWDRDHGLLAFAPFFVLGIPGLVAMARQHRKELGLILLMTVPTFVIVASHWMWWGGPCPAGRFLLPIIVFAGPLLALGFASRGGAFRSAFVLLAVLLSVEFGVRGMQYPNVTQFHTHVGCADFPGLVGYPLLPLFFVHRHDPMPVSSYVLLALWLIPVAGLLVGALRQQTGQDLPPVANEPRPGRLVACVSLILLMPGVFSTINAALNNGHAQVMDDERMAVRRTYAWQQCFMDPILRGGGDVSAIVGTIVPKLVQEADSSLDAWLQRAMATLPDHPALLSALAAMDRSHGDVAGATNYEHRRQEVMRLTPACPVAVRYHGGLALTGVTGHGLRGAPGDMVQMRLFWQMPCADEPQPTVFLHVDKGAKTLFQFDVLVMEGRSPHQLAGRAVSQEIALRIPPGTPAGQYTLHVGVVGPGGKLRWSPTTNLPVHRRAVQLPIDVVVTPPPNAGS